MRVGEALDDALGGSGRSWEPATITQAIAVAIHQGGGTVSGAARWLGVPRRTLRTWIDQGRAGTGPRSALGKARQTAVVRTTTAQVRRARMPAGKEQDIRTGRRRLQLRGVTTRFKSPRRKGGEQVRKGRTLDVGKHIQPREFARVLDAWLDGAPLAEVENSLMGLIDTHYAPDMLISTVGRADFR